MRYRAGEQPEAWPYAVSEPWLLFTVVLGVLVGFALIAMGVKGRQLWMLVWGTGQVLVSVAYLGWAAFGP